MCCGVSGSVSSFNLFPGEVRLFPSPPALFWPFARPALAATRQTDRVTAPPSKFPLCGGVPIAEALHHPTQLNGYTSANSTSTFTARPPPSASAPPTWHLGRLPQIPSVSGMSRGDRTCIKWSFSPCNVYRPCETRCPCPRLGRLKTRWPSPWSQHAAAPRQ